MNKLFLLVSVLFIAASCATVKVTSDFDKTAKFPGYKTYALTPEAMNLNADELNKKRIISAVENELSLKGFKKSEPRCQRGCGALVIWGRRSIRCWVGWRTC